MSYDPNLQYISHQHQTHTREIQQHFKQPHLILHPNCAASRTVQVFLDLAHIEAIQVTSNTPEGTHLIKSIKPTALPALIIGSDLFCEAHNILRTISGQTNGQTQNWYKKEGQSGIELWLRWRYVCLGRCIMDHMTRKKLATRGSNTNTMMMMMTTTMTLSRTSIAPTTASQLMRCLRLLDRSLRKRRFLCTHLHPTLADISIAAALVDLELVDLDWSRFPSLCKWHQNLMTSFPTWGVAFDPVYFRVARKRGFSRLNSSIQSDAVTKDNFFDFFDPDWIFLHRFYDPSYTTPLSRDEEKMLIETNTNLAPSSSLLVPRSKEPKMQLPLCYEFNSELIQGFVRIVVDSHPPSLIPFPRRIQDLQQLCVYLHTFYPRSRLEFWDENGDPVLLPNGPTAEMWETLMPLLHTIRVFPPRIYRTYGRQIPDPTATSTTNPDPDLIPIPIPMKQQKKPVRRTRRKADLENTKQSAVTAPAGRVDGSASLNRRSHDFLPALSLPSGNRRASTPPSNPGQSSPKSRSMPIDPRHLLPQPHPSIPTSDFLIRLPSIAVRPIVPNKK